MQENSLILDILKNTIGTLSDNKNSICEISETLKKNYEKKKQELANIKEQLPLVFEETHRLRREGRILRNQLSCSADNFSERGYETMQSLFSKASHIHGQFLQSEEKESQLIRKRDEMEIELRRDLLMIEQAENIAQQLFVSISYLQTNLTQLSQEESASSELSAQHLNFFKFIENEKSRIARDLHDGPAQQIVGAQLNIDFCINTLQTDLHKGLRLLETLKQDLSNTLTDIRGILFDLHLAPLEKIGLQSAIHNLLYSILPSDTLQIKFFYTLDTTHISLMQQRSIYRIVQELLNNIKKHAKASTVMLRMSHHEDMISITLMDNGVGFDVPENINDFFLKQKSYGLSNIYTRTNELNGKISLFSDKKQGTCFKIQLPILTT